MQHDYIQVYHHKTKNSIQNITRELAVLVIFTHLSVLSAMAWSLA